jgi:hypothetical protein
MPAIAARDIEEMAVRAAVKDAREKVDLGASLLWSKTLAPRIQRDAAKKILFPIGWHFFSFEKAHVDCRGWAAKKN